MRAPLLTPGWTSTLTSTFLLALGCSVGCNCDSAPGIADADASILPAPDAAPDATPDAAPLACSVDIVYDNGIYDNGAYDSVNGLLANQWSTGGIIEDFVLTEPNTGFCTIQFTMLRNFSGADFRTARIRIIELDAGGVAALGDFAQAVFVFDNIYSEAGGTLLIEDTGDDSQGLDIVRYSAAGTGANLGAGRFGIHLSFIDYTGDDGGWATAPETGTTECAHFWGGPDTTPLDACIKTGQTWVENLDFRLLN